MPGTCPLRQVYSRKIARLSLLLCDFLDPASLCLFLLTIVDILLTLSLVPPSSRESAVPAFSFWSRLQHFAILIAGASSPLSLLSLHKDLPPLFGPFLLVSRGVFLGRPHRHRLVNLLQLSASFSLLGSFRISPVSISSGGSGLVGDFSVCPWTSIETSATTTRPFQPIQLAALRYQPPDIVFCRFSLPRTSSAAFWSVHGHPVTPTRPSSRFPFSPFSPLCWAPGALAGPRTPLCLGSAHKGPNATPAAPTCPLRRNGACRPHLALTGALRRSRCWVPSYRIS